MGILFRYFASIMNRATRRKFHVLLLVGAVAVLYLYGSHRTSTSSSPPNTGSKRQTWYHYIFGEKSLPAPSQEDVDYMASNVVVRYDVVDNFPDRYFIARYTFINTGSRPVPAKRWQLYFYSMRAMEPFESPYPYGFYIRGCGLKLYHFDGYLYWLEPVSGYFTGIAPGHAITCTLKLYNTQVARSDSMPNWYFVGNDLSPKIIQSTRSEDLTFVGDFQRRNQFLRRDNETDHPYSPAERYDIYRASAVKVAKPSKILPTPLEISTDESQTLEWNSNTWVVLTSGPFQNESIFLADKLKIKRASIKPAKKYIEFIKKDVDVSKYDVIKEEAYALTTDTQKQVIYVTSGTATGAFYGVQTLMSLVFTPEAVSSKGIFTIVPSFKVTDAPRYSYRGIHIDVARNFMGPDEIRKILDAMAMYKMNKLHLHLSDDEGWRLEIPGMPELTQIGSKRCHDPDEEQCLMPMLGSGPDLTTSGTGHYDVGTYKALLKLANILHIEVIPEIDMPGHSRAAIKSIHAKSQKSHRTSMNADAYNVVEDGDKSTLLYKSAQNFHGDVLNPCMTETYKFVTKLLTEVKRMHEGIQPLKFFHFGGDEVANMAWNKSKICEKLARGQPEVATHYGKMRYFVSRLSEAASQLGLSVGSWEDGVMEHEMAQGEDGTYEKLGKPFPREHFKNKNIYVYVWKNPTVPLTPHRLRLLANYGYKVILAYGSHFYFDHPYEANPEERGLYWATRKLPLYTVWNFTSAIAEGDMELPCPESVRDKTDCYKLKKPENIVGIQAEVWTETIRTPEQMDFMLFPRLLAVAERAWHTSTWETSATENAKADKAADYAAFVNLIGSKELKRLDLIGVKYRVPPPGAKVQDGKVAFRTEFPGLDIEYYVDSEKAWKIASHNMPISHPLKIRTRSADGTRASRVIVVEPWDTSGSKGSIYVGKSVTGNCLLFCLLFLITVTIR